jgi:hypothetical protein
MTGHDKERLVRLALQIADSTAMSDIESFTAPEEKQGKHQGCWYNTAIRLPPFLRGAVDRAVEYLDLKGQLEHYPGRPALVRKKVAS